MARPLAHEWRAKAAIWPAKANRQLASSTYAGAFRIAELVRTDVDRRDDRLPGQLPGSRGPCRHDRGAIAASVAEHAGRDQAPRGRPRRDGELEGLQPRLPGPAQRAPSAPWLPLNRTSLVVSAHHRADSSGSGLGIFPIGDSRAFKAETGFPPHSRKRRPPPCGRQKEAGGEGASESALIPSAPSGHGTVRSLPLRYIVPAARAHMRDGRGPAPAFSGQKLVTTRHCAMTPFDGTKRRRIIRRRLR